jgi:dipeptidase D
MPEHNRADNYVARVLSVFEEISAIPRCSKNEQRISEWLVEWAGARGLASEQDDQRNTRIDVPGNGDAAEGPTVVLQGHMDMVCEKTPTSSHDFAEDPIRVIRDGEWLHADQTTLGADNGIAIAIALTIAESDLARPPLEILMTVNEETGLVGAQSIKPGFLKGRRLINLDSEDEGVVTVGCAGGQDTLLSLPVNREPIGDRLIRQVTVSGLEGGHSGVDIHRGRANANVLLARVLGRLPDGDGCAIVIMSGGSAHNAIPRDADAIVAVPSSALARLEEVVAAVQAELTREYAIADPGVSVSLSTPDERAADEEALSLESTRTLINLISALPYGVIRMSDGVPGLVETSTNLATLRTEKDTVKINTSQRSAYASRLQEVATKIVATARLAGATTEVVSKYPPWEPDPRNPMLARSTTAYRSVFGVEPKVEIVHAGLECGIIGSRYEQMEMISIGPTIENPHSPDERLFVPSLARVWQFLEALLGSCAV